MATIISLAVPLLHLLFRFLGLDAAAKFVYQIAVGHIFLVEAKRQLGVGLRQFIPEAVTQAMNIASNTK